MVCWASLFCRCFSQDLLSGFIAGCAAATANNPFDVVKTRQQAKKEIWISLLSYLNIFEHWIFVNQIQPDSLQRSKVMAASALSSHAAGQDESTGGKTVCHFFNNQLVHVCSMASSTVRSFSMASSKMFETRWFLIPWPFLKATFGIGFGGRNLPRAQALWVKWQWSWCDVMGGKLRSNRVFRGELFPESFKRVFPLRLSQMVGRVIKLTTEGNKM